MDERPPSDLISDYKADPPFPRHRSEQNFTASQSRAHFLRHANGSPHAAQVFVGRTDLRTILGIGQRLMFRTTAYLSPHRRQVPTHRREIPYQRRESAFLF